ncbi:MAG: hypothetical protein H0U03_06965 [Actinobacteria bacterium]|nr:hypothetical protein [Actinomycetota bacterium]
MATSGAFFRENVVVFEQLREGQTSWVGERQLAPGTYYVHVAGWDNEDAREEWSSVKKLVIAKVIVPAGAVAAMERTRAYGLLYLPTWLPPGFRYRRWSFKSDVLTVQFWRGRVDPTLYWTVANRLGATEPCNAYSSRRYRTGGMTIYMGSGNHGRSVWRCTKSAGGIPISVDVWDPHAVRLPDLVRMVATAKPVPYP